MCSLRLFSFRSILCRIFKQSLLVFWASSPLLTIFTVRACLSLHSFLFLFLAPLRRLIDLLLVGHENLHENAVADEKANDEHDSIHADDVLLEGKVDYRIEQEHGDRDIGRVVESVAYTDEDRDDQVHLDVFELARVKVILASHLVHRDCGAEHDAASDYLTHDA